MKKLAVLCAIAMSTLLVTLGFAPSAHAAYPEFQMTVDVQPRVVVGGNDIESTSSANADCRWTHKFNGKKKKGNGTDFSATFRTPVVDEVTIMPVVFTCSFEASTVTEAKAERETATRTINVKVLPQGEGAIAPDNAGGDLPNTGGPNVIFLILGLLLLLAGVAAVRFARGRDEDAGTDPSLA